MKTFGLLGVELNESIDAHGNYQRVGELRQDLLNLGLQFVGVTNVSDSKKSQLFMVVDAEESVLKSLARKYGQKAILISDNQLNTEVVSTKSNGRTKLGKLTSVTSQTAKQHPFYITFVEDGKEYFYVTTGGTNVNKATGKNSRNRNSNQHGLA